MQDKIYSSVLNFLTPLDLSDTYKRVTQEAIKLTGAKYGSVFVPQNGRMIRVFTTCVQLNQIVPRRKGKTMDVFRKKNFYLLDVDDLGVGLEIYEKLGVKHDLSVALKYDKTKIGVLSLLSDKNHPFKKRDIENIKHFSHLATIVIKKATLHERLKGALKARDLFISIAAHELKTPLTSILLYTQLLKKRLEDGKLPEKSHLETLLSEEKRLAKLINELLQTEQIKRGGLNFEMEKCDLVDIIKNSLLESKTILEKRVIFKNQILEKAYITGDQNKLIQVFSNLLHNAAKYSPPKSSISINLKSEAGSFKIEIKDKGAGISEEDLPHVFKSFYQGNNGPKLGMGIGLYLVRHIIENHNGQIKLNSSEGKGTTAVVKLPKA